MTISVEVRGIERVNKFLEGKNRQIDQNADKGVNKATFFMHGEVKSSIAGQRAEPTSVDTGRFLNSVDLTTSKHQGLIFTDVPYAKFLEHGTSKFRARKHFGNSLKRNQRKVNEIIKEEVKKATS